MPSTPPPQQSPHAKPTTPPQPLSVGEATVVAARYELAQISTVRALPGGQTARLDTADGSLVLKRRPSHMSERLAAAHTVVAALQARGMSVRRPLRAQDGSTVVHVGGSLSNWIYDLTPWIDGERFDGSTEQASASGQSLAQLHLQLQRVRASVHHASLSIHDRPGVTQALVSTGENGLEAAQLYRQTCIKVGEQQPSAWEQQLVHGDWHRGNVLFEAGSPKVAAILDFDEVGSAPALVELVCGAVQFAAQIPETHLALPPQGQLQGLLHGEGQTQSNWPSQTDPRRIEAFIQGYRSVRRTGKLWTRAWQPEKRQARAGAWIMAQSLLAQGAGMISRGETPGPPRQPLDGFVEMVLRKARWLVEQEDWIADLLQRA